MKIEPCPMCGGVAFITTGSIVELWQQKVMCCECGLNIVRGGVSPSHAKERAVEAWNRRKPLEDIVEQLEAEEYDVNCNICDYDSEIDTNTLQYYEGKEDGIRSAIEIVKGGTV